MLSDEELVYRISKKDPKAFEQFVSRYQNQVLKICYSFLGDYHRAEDAAQDVFVQIYRKAQSFRSESKVFTWIYRMAVNSSLNIIRKEKRFQWMKKVDFSKSDQYPGEKIPSDSIKNEPEALLEKKERIKVLRKAVNRLPEKQRTAIILNKFEGFSAEEISEILGVSINTVEVRIHRAKRKLQSDLVSLFKL